MLDPLVVVVLRHALDDFPDFRYWDVNGPHDFLSVGYLDVPVDEPHLWDFDVHVVVPRFDWASHNPLPVLNRRLYPLSRMYTPVVMYMRMSRDRMSRDRMSRDRMSHDGTSEFITRVSVSIDEMLGRRGEHRRRVETTEGISEEVHGNGISL
jgi:hypothetical protein